MLTYIPDAYHYVTLPQTPIIESESTGEVSCDDCPEGIDQPLVNPRCLTPIPQESGSPPSWAIRAKQIVTSNDLKQLAEYKGQITEVRAPLSNVSVEALHTFLTAHGPSIVAFNLQNNKLTGTDLVHCVELMPNLDRLSLQYIHSLENDDLKKVLMICRKVSRLFLSQNGRIRPNLLKEIIALGRHFGKLSLDFSGTTPIAQGELTGAEFKKVKSSVTELRLSGLSVCDELLANLEELEIKPNKVELVGTSVTGKAMKRFQRVMSNRNLTPDKMIMKSINPSAEHTLMEELQHQEIRFKRMPGGGISIKM